MSEHITELTTQDCAWRAKQFENAYGLKVTITGFIFNDKDWNYDKVILKFLDAAGKRYSLIEYFPPGKDNSTDYVEFCYEHEDMTVTKVFKKFIDAELAMVQLIKERKDGKG